MGPPTICTNGSGLYAIKVMPVAWGLCWWLTRSASATPRWDWTTTLKLRTSCSCISMYQLKYRVQIWVVPLRRQRCYTGKGTNRPLPQGELPFAHLPHGARRPTVVIVLYPVLWIELDCLSQWMMPVFSFNVIIYVSGGFSVSMFESQNCPFHSCFYQEPTWSPASHPATLLSGRRTAAAAAAAAALTLG